MWPLNIQGRSSPQIDESVERRSGEVIDGVVGTVVPEQLLAGGDVLGRLEEESQRQLGVVDHPLQPLPWDDVGALGQTRVVNPRHLRAAKLAVDDDVARAVKVGDVGRPPLPACRHGVGEGLAKILPDDLVLGQVDSGEASLASTGDGAGGEVELVVLVTEVAVSTVAVASAAPSSLNAGTEAVAGSLAHLRALGLPALAVGHHVRGRGGVGGGRRRLLHLGEGLLVRGGLGEGEDVVHGEVHGEARALPGRRRAAQGLLVRRELVQGEYVHGEGDGARTLLGNRQGRVGVVVRGVGHHVKHGDGARGTD